MRYTKRGGRRQTTGDARCVNERGEMCAPCKSDTARLAFRWDAEDRQTAERDVMKA
jgi:hypothetical protein